MHFKEKFLLVAFSLGSCFISMGQVGINTNNPHPSSILHIEDERRGLLIPRFEASDRVDMIMGPADGLMVFDTDHKMFYFYDDDANQWISINPWRLDGTDNPTNTNDVIYNGSGNVGIGTAGDPISYKLEVAGSIGTSYVYGRTTTTGLRLYSNDGKGIVIREGGLVGIHRTNPDDTLDVNGSIDLTGSLKMDNQVVLSNYNNNIICGIGAGVNMEGGVWDRNTIIGNDAATNMTRGIGNVILGRGAAENSGLELHGNVIIGNYAGRNANDTYTGLLSSNVFIGSEAGREIQGGLNNIFIGDAAARDKTGGYGNICMGMFTGLSNGNGDYNILLGDQAGQMMGTGSSNIFIGQGVGLMADGSENIYIGLRTGFSDNGSNNVLIGNGVSAFGNSDYMNIADYVTGELTTTTAGRLVTVRGDFEVTGACADCASDSTLKRSMKPLSSGSLEKISRLNGYTYLWKENTHQYERDKELQVGLMAQEVQREFPLLVGTSQAGHLYVDYQKMVVPLVEAVKELKDNLDEKEYQIRQLEKRVSEMEAKEKQLKEMEDRLVRLEQLLQQTH